MRRQFIIVNHAHRNLSGHHFDCALAIAEAARETGWRPVVATHVDCLPGLVPNWLEVHPLFCTDHAMIEPAAEPPDLAGAQVEPYSRPAVSIECVRSGRATVREFLAGRFVSVSPAAPPATPQCQRALLGLRGRGRWFCRKAVWAARRGAFYLSPPFLYNGCRFLVRSVERQCVPPVFRREHRQRIRSRLGQIVAKVRLFAVRRLDFSSCGPALSAALEHPLERPMVEQALGELAPLGLVQEIEHALVFKRDLERLLAIVGVHSDDHVLVTMAHARELLAVHVVARRLGKRRCPTFHLQFRDVVFAREPNPNRIDDSPPARLYRGFFSLHERWDASNRVHVDAHTQSAWPARHTAHALVAALTCGVKDVGDENSGK